MIRIKICGITTIQDALTAVKMGADAIGLIFVPSSPRRVTPAQARRIVREVPPFVTVVGVVADLTSPRAVDLATDCRLQVIQLHGEESPEVCASVRTVVPVIKAIRVRDAASVAAIRRYRRVVDAILLDTYQPDRLGGTGRPFDWRVAARGARHGVPIILSGGLTPATVAQAIRRVRPFGVDVSSGVERRPGVKDPAKLRAFLHAARRAGFS